MIRSVNLSSDQFALISVVLSCVPVYGELLQGTDVLPPTGGTVVKKNITGHGPRYPLKGESSGVQTAEADRFFSHSSFLVLQSVAYFLIGSHTGHINIRL